MVNAGPDSDDTAKPAAAKVIQNSLDDNEPFQKIFDRRPFCCKVVPPIKRTAALFLGDFPGHIGIGGPQIFPQGKTRVIVVK